MAHLPLFKLGVLLVKQATKPMARAVKSRAQASDKLSKVCEFLGQTWHEQTTKLNLRVQGHKVKGVKPLNEAEAVQSGAELLSEGFVLSVGIAALIIEARRSARSAAEKAMQKAHRRQQKMEAMQHLNDTMRDLAQYSIDLRRTINEHEKKRIDFEKQHKKQTVPALQLPSVPISLAEMVGVDAITPTEIAVAAHNKALEKKSEDWMKGTLQKIGLDSATNLIKFIGNTINGTDDDDGDDGDDGGDEE